MWDAAFATGTALTCITAGIVCLVFYGKMDKYDTFHGTPVQEPSGSYYVQGLGTRKGTRTPSFTPKTVPKGAEWVVYSLQKPTYYTTQPSGSTPGMGARATMITIACIGFLVVAGSIVRLVLLKKKKAKGDGYSAFLLGLPVVGLLMFIFGLSFGIPFDGTDWMKESGVLDDTLQVRMADGRVIPHQGGIPGTTVTLFRASQDLVTLKPRAVDLAVVGIILIITGAILGLLLLGTFYHYKKRKERGP